MATTTQDGGFIENFDTLDPNDWYVSDFVIQEDWLHTTWEANNVTQSNGTITLELNTADQDGKDFTGAEVQSMETYGYGRYEVTMQASGEVGVNSNFFTYTGPYFGDDWSEVDFEFLGKDPTKVWVNYHSGEGHYEGAWIDLGFDASQGMHDYAFEWQPNSISWYVDDVLIHEVVNPELAVPNAPGKIYMNIWAGVPEWLGTPTFTDSTTATYSDVSFTPWDGVYTHDPEGDAATAPAIRAYLVDADTEELIGELTDGSTFDATVVAGRNLTIYADVNADDPSGSLVESMVLNFDDGAVTKTENLAPYALFGDNGMTDLYGGMALDAGSHSITFTLFDADAAAGSVLGSTTLGFEVTETEPVAEPEPQPEPEPEPQPEPEPEPEHSISATDDAATTSAGQAVTIDVLANDSDPLGHALHIASAESATTGGTVSFTESELVYTPDAGFWGEDRFSYTVSDGLGATDTAEVVVSVSEPPPPAASELELFLVNADTGAIVTAITDGTRINASELDGLNTTIMARVADSAEFAGSEEAFVFELSGAMFYQEVDRSEPYALLREKGKGFSGTEFGVGHYLLDVEAHDHNRASGEPLAAEGFEFAIVDDWAGATDLLI